MVFINKLTYLKKNYKFLINCRFFEDRGHMANIVAVDFFRGTDIVESALYWNSRKESFVLIN